MAKINELKEWHTETKAELYAAKSKLREAQEEVRAIEQKLQSLESLYLLEGGNPSQIEAIKGSDSDRIIVETEKILKASGESMHIRALREALIGTGLTLPGKGTDANLIAKYQRSKGRIVRTSRGYYYLGESK